MTEGYVNVVYCLVKGALKITNINIKYWLFDLEMPVGMMDRCARRTGPEPMGLANWTVPI